MRNSNRIKVVNNLIEALWLKYPDMRYFQLMDSIKAEHNVLNNKNPSTDMFYVEDDSFEETLYKILGNGFSNGRNDPSADNFMGNY